MREWRLKREDVKDRERCRAAGQPMHKQGKQPQRTVVFCCTCRSK